MVNDLFAYRKWIELLFGAHGCWRVNGYLSDFLRYLSNQSFRWSLCFQAAIGGCIAHHLTGRRIIATIKSSLHGIRRYRFQRYLLIYTKRIRLRMVKYADVVAVRLLTFDWFLCFGVFARGGLILRLYLFWSCLGVTEGGLRHGFAAFGRLETGAWLLAQFGGRCGNLSKTRLKSRTDIFDETTLLNKLLIFGVFYLINDYLRGIDPARLIHLKIIFVRVTDFPDTHLFSLAGLDDVGSHCLGWFFTSYCGGTLALSTLLASFGNGEAAGRYAIIIGPFSVVK